MTPEPQPSEAPRRALLPGEAPWPSSPLRFAMRLSVGPHRVTVQSVFAQSPGQPLVPCFARAEDVTLAAGQETVLDYVNAATMALAACQSGGLAPPVPEQTGVVATGSWWSNLSPGGRVGVVGAVGLAVGLGALYAADRYS